MGESDAVCESERVKLPVTEGVPETDVERLALADWLTVTVEERLAVREGDCEAVDETDAVKLNAPAARRQSTISRTTLLPVSATTTTWYAVTAAAEAAPKKVLFVLFAEVSGTATAPGAKNFDWRACVADSVLPETPVPASTAATAELPAAE